MTTSLTSIGHFSVTNGGEEKTGGSQTEGQAISLTGNIFDNTFTLAGGSGAAGAAVTCWSTSILPADFDFLWVKSDDSSDMQIELSLGTTDAIYFQLQQGVEFKLGRDDVLLRAAYNATPFNSPGAAAVVTRIAARNSATATTTSGTLRVVVGT